MPARSVTDPSPGPSRVASSVIGPETLKPTDLEAAVARRPSLVLSSARSELKAAVVEGVR